MDLFERIAALPAPERGRAMAAASAEDPELAAWVQRMLDADEEDWQPPDVVEQLAVGLLGDPLAPGAEVGGFVLEARLGSGGMAAVWRAAQDRPQRRVALKILHPWLRTPLLLDRFRFEGDALARVRHPAFPEIFASGEQDGRPWIAMELVEGATLREWLAAELPPPEARLGVLIALVEAVAALHRLGLVHRDLTPANVLIDRGGAPRVVDLGVAVDGDDDELVRRMAVGTPGWASPEQGGDALATPSSDVYALGALGRMLVLGARGAAAGPLDDVSAILERASSPRAEDRYPDASVFAEDLRRARDGYPVSAVGGGVGYRLQRWAGRHRRSLRALAIAAGVVAVAAGTAGADRLLRRARDHQAAADGLAAATAAAERAEGPQEALSELRAWLELPESAPLAWEGWLAVALRARVARDGDAELDALARAWVAARDDAQEAEVLARAVDALLQRWSFRAALAVGKPAQDRLPVDTRATLRLLAGDMAGALRWMAPDDPRAPLARALSHATQTLAPGAVFTTTAEADGPLFALDRAQRTIVELARRVDLAPVRSWTLGALEPDWPRTHLISLDARYLVAEQEGLPGWIVGVRLDEHGITRVGAWPEARVQRIAVDRSGGRPKLLLGTGPYDRHLVELDPDSWQLSAPSPDADALQSDIMDVVVAQLDDDPADEVLLGYGPWWAFGVARLDRGDDGVLRRTAFAALGFVHDVAVIRTAQGPRVVALKSDRYSAPELFGAAQPFGPAQAGVHLLHPEDLSEDRVLSLEGPPGAEGTLGYVYAQVGDIDGDGLDDIAVWVDRDDPGHGWFNRQLPDGSFAGFVVAGHIPVAISDLDGDGDAEVVVREAGTDTPAWVLGAGDAALPISDPPPAVDEPPPAALRSEGARAAWRDAEVLRELGLARRAAPSLLRAAAAAPPGDAALLALRAGALAEAAADLSTALDAFGRVAGGADPAGALGLHRVARSVVDLDAASIAAARLAETDPSWQAEVDRLRALRAEPPVVWRAGGGGLPDTVWRFPSPAAVHRTASGAFDTSLLAGQSAVLVLPLEGDGRRVGVTARFDIAVLDPGVELEFGIVGVGGDLVSVRFGREGRSGIIDGRCKAVGIDEVGVFPSETVGDGTVEIELARVADGVSCRISAGGTSRLYRSASPAVDLTPVAFVVHDRAAGDYGLPKSTMARVLVQEVTVLGARVAASVPDPGVWELVTGGAPEACFRPDVCLVAALRRGGAAPAVVDALLREPAGMETMHLLARTGTPSELERLRAAMSPDAFADLITAAWAGTLTHAPAAQVLEHLDQPWLGTVRPDATQRILLLAHVASALAEVGRTSRAMGMYGSLTTPEVLARVSALNRLNLLEGRARVELSTGRTDAARETIARALVATPVPDAVRRRLSVDPQLATLLPP